MILLPVIERELRAQARRPGLYHARLAWGLCALSFLTILLFFEKRMANHGSYVYSVIHGSLAFIFLVTAPISVADSISSERREGTLGLLFLTQLTAAQIVVGKFAAHFFRLFYLWLLMAPMMMLPVLIGGVGLEQFLISIAILLSILMTAVAAGMIASALFIAFGSALIWSLMLAVAGIVIISGAVINVPYLADADREHPEPLIVRFLLFGPLVCAVPQVFLPEFTSVFAIRNLSAMLVGGIFVTSALFLLSATWLCVWRVARHAESAIPTARQEKLRRSFFTPILWKDALRRRMSRSLTRNPFVWLEYRTATMRVGRWLAMGALIIFETYLVQTNPSLQGFCGAQFPILCVLLAAVTLRSASSFQYEKESGAFELILVTTMKERPLVNGRLRAIIGYYLPITLSLFFFFSFGFFIDGMPYLYRHKATLNLLCIWLSLFSVPTAGLYFALRCKTFFPALLWTIGLGIVGAPLLWTAFNNAVWFLVYRFDCRSLYPLEELLRERAWPQLLFILLYHGALIFWMRRAAIARLEKRDFSFR